MNAMELLTGPFAQAIGWALLHLLWQATVVAGILAAVLALLPRQSANARYVAACSALALVFAMFVTTAVRAYDPAAAPIAVTASSPVEEATKLIPLSRVPAVIAATAAASWRDRAIDAVTSARQSLPSVVALWFLGVVILSSRLLLSWFRAHALVTRGTREADAAMQRVAQRLSDALGLKSAVRLLESAAVEVPSVLGSFRPVILLPASALLGLTPQQLEMVLAHELAHIRRHDFLINLLQAFVETLMFFHPAVWWMSSRVRIERENCCDDMAVAVCGNPIQYAKALTRLEELRADSLSVVVAANGGSLLGRIRRIAAGRAESTSSASRWFAAVAMLAILGLALAVPSLPALAQRETKNDTPTPAEAKLDVVEETPDSDDEMYEAGEPAEPEDEVDVAEADWETPGTPAAPEPPDYDFDAYTPVPAIAPVPMIAVTPGMPAIAPMAPMAAIAPFPSRAPMAIAIGDWSDDDDAETPKARKQRRSVKDRKLGADGKLTVDELIALRASGATPEYINQMRAHFPNLTIGELAGLSSMGVTADFLRQMREIGFNVSDPEDVTGLKAMNVTPEFVKQMKATGFDLSSAEDATSLRAMNVTPEFVKQMRDAGFTVRTAEEATGLRAMNVTPEFVKEMRAAGFEVKHADDATSLRAMNVTPAWIKEMRDAGVNIKSAEDATSLRAVGVTPKFVKQLAAAGYTNLSVEELTSMAAHGINDEFIRDMEQYRTKQ